MSQHFLDPGVRRSFIAICEKAKTPIAMEALHALKSDDWLGLVSLAVEPKDYRDPRSYLVDNQIVGFFKKCAGLPTGVDTKKVAIDNFWKSERQCFIANKRLNSLLWDRLVYGSDVSTFIGKIRKKLKWVLGPCPTVNDLVRDARFGPGSTLRDVGPLITVPDKMSEDVTITAEVALLWGVMDESAWSRYALAGYLQPDGPEFQGPPAPQHLQSFASRGLNLVRGNRFTTVPKDAKKDRGICIEPSGNLFLQLAAGTALTKRMGLKWGWSKKTVQQLHRYWAQLASSIGHLATVDLSNASDTVCEALVRLLLPEDWFLLLDTLRSKTTEIQGKTYHLEKFSSMGNGFTFELETLLFRVIVEAVAEGKTFDTSFDGGRISTFGDDIICPTGIAQDVIAALEFFGFETNKDKTFVSGPFRESCGGDFFNGKPVRAHYLKELPNEPHQYISLANGLYRFCLSHNMCGGWDDYNHIRLRVLDRLPSGIRACKGPESLGDLVIHSPPEEWRYRVRSSIRYFRVWRPVRFGKTSWDHFRPGVVFATALYGAPDGAPTGIQVLALDRRKPAGGLDTRVNGLYVSGYRYGQVAQS